MFSEEMVVFSDTSSLFSAFTIKERPFPSSPLISTYKGFSYRNFPPRLVAPSMPTAEATAKVHTPLWILWSFRGLGHTIIVFLPEGYFLVVKGRLYLPDIPVRVLHGREPQAIPQTFQSGLPLRRGWVVLPQEGFKFVSVPQMGLFRSRQALTGQKQAKKILKIPGQRIDAVPQRIGLINSKRRSELPFPLAALFIAMFARKIASCRSGDTRCCLCALIIWM